MLMGALTTAYGIRSSYSTTLLCCFNWTFSKTYEYALFVTAFIVFGGIILLI